MAEQKIGLIGIQNRISNYEDIEVSRLYEIVGRNTGNLLFTNAVVNQIKGDVCRIGYGFDPLEVSNAFDAIVIPAANWLGEHTDMGFLADRLEKVRIPCILIGLGAQSDLEKEIPVIPNGTLKLLEIISNKSRKISVRGNFTAEVLDSYGFHNVAVTGCPSLFLDLNKNREISKSRIEHFPKSVAFSSTRYQIDSSLFTKGYSGRVNAMLFRSAFKLGTDIFFQSEIPEFQVLVSDHYRRFQLENFFNSTKGDDLKRLYGAESTSELIEYLLKHGKIYFDIDKWFNKLKEYQFFIGTRIHGVVAALLSGTPSILLSHDSRTEELAEFCGIPMATVDVSTDLLDKDVIEELYEACDLEKFKETSIINYGIFRDFYIGNSIDTNF